MSRYGHSSPWDRTWVTGETTCGGRSSASPTSPASPRSTRPTRSAGPAGPGGLPQLRRRTAHPAARRARSCWVWPRRPRRRPSGYGSSAGGLALSMWTCCSSATRWFPSRTSCRARTHVCGSGGRLLVPLADLAPELVVGHLTYRHRAGGTAGWAALGVVWARQLCPPVFDNFAPENCQVIPPIFQPTLWAAGRETKRLHEAAQCERRSGPG